MSGTGYAPNSVDAFGLGRDVMSTAQAQSIKSRNCSTGVSAVVLLVLGGAGRCWCSCWLVQVAFRIYWQLKA
jgi:hypothetical protein